MSDEMFDTEDEAGGKEQQSAGKKRIGFLPSVVIDILKWVLIVVGAIIFIVVVVFITVRRIGAGNQAGDIRLPIAEEFLTGNVERLDFFRQIGDIRGTTSDEPRRTFIVTPLIGYRPEVEATLQELIQRAPQIKERIAIYFSLRSVEELQDADDRARVKRDLIEEVNQMMENDIRDVVFDRYEFIEF